MQTVIQVLSYLWLYVITYENCSKTKPKCNLRDLTKLPTTSEIYPIAAKYLNPNTLNCLSHNFKIPPLSLLVSIQTSSQKHNNSNSSNQHQQTDNKCNTTQNNSTLRHTKWNRWNSGGEFKSQLNLMKPNAIMKLAITN